MPDSPNAADTLGWAYYKLGLPESAVVQLKESARKTPDNPMYQYHLGMAYMAAGHVDSAKQALQHALRDNPDFSYAAVARASLDRISQRPHQNTRN
jgi:tetratricopeptide (TPR) repeat protein